jgi:phytoene dehydrogenase-like protein
VSSGTVGALARRVIGAVPGLRKPGAGRFFYPRQGYGQISHVFQNAATAAGARVELGANVVGVVVENNRVRQVEVDAGGTRREVAASCVLSTIPIAVLARLVQTNGPRAAARHRRVAAASRDGAHLPHAGHRSVHRVRRPLFS